MNLKMFKNKNVSAFFGMIVGTIIYCMAVVYVIDLGDFYTGGITGVAQVIESLVIYLFGGTFSGFKSILIALFNAPLLIMAWNGVSKRFAIVSLTSIIIQVVLIAFFELLKNNYGFSPFQNIKDRNDILTLAILGGLVTGAGCGIALKYGASTGGMDVVSQYVSLKKHSSFVKVSLTLDMLIVLAGAIIGLIQNLGLEIAVYTIIRLIISILVIDKVHTIYKYTKVTIITEEKQKVRDALIEKFNHGITIYSAVGGFTNKPKYVLDSICWSFETSEYKRIAKSVDPNCFITHTSVKKVDGTFSVNVIA